MKYFVKGVDWFIWYRLGKLQCLVNIRKKASGSMKVGEYVDQLSGCQLSIMNSGL